MNLFFWSALSLPSTRKAGRGWPAGRERGLVHGQAELKFGAPERATSRRAAAAVVP